jgi:hypothetical protein
VTEAALILTFIRSMTDCNPQSFNCATGTWVLCMEYTIDVVNVEREVADQHYKAKAVYTFTISNGFAKTHADVVLTEAGAAIIEQKGKDPQTAAKIVLERLLKQGRDPFESQILLTVPYGHAEHFARFGNYETLPTLAD